MARKKIEHNTMSDDEREAFQEYYQTVMGAVVPGHPWYSARQRLDALMAGDLSETPKTYEDWLDAVSSSCKVGPFHTYNYYGRILRFVPQEFITAELCLAAVKNEGSALEFVPRALKTEEICRATIRCGHDTGMGGNWKGCGASLKFVPDEIKTRDLCFDAMLNQGTFDDVPDPIKTREFYLAVLTERDYGYTSEDKAMVNAVPDTVKSAEFYLEVIQRQRRAFKHIPDEYKTTEMCRFAVEHDVYSGGWVSASAYYRCATPELAYVPDALKTPELCAAAAVNWHALQYVPDALKTTEMCLAAVLACELAREYVPESLAESLVKKVNVVGQEEDYILLADEETGRTKKIHQSLITVNELTIENETIKISPSLYNSWFMGENKQGEKLYE